MFLSAEQAEIRRRFLENELHKLPDGKKVLNHGKYPALYIKTCPGRSELNGKRILLKKKDARELLTKIELRRQYENELNEIDSFLSKPLKLRNTKVQVMDRDFFVAWTGIISNDRPKEKFAPKLNDMRFRSKSELAIAELLSSLGYEFAYEPAFYWVDRFISPDFLFWVPEANRCFFIEHFGSMGNEDYEKSTWEKISYYVREGFTPGLDIIFTFEGNNVPFSANVVLSQINAAIVAATTEI